jgi:zinc/manganese transport system substrate-binding protein
LPNQDPHFVDARPNLALAVSRADLVLMVGLDLEVGWMPTLLLGSRNPRVQVGTSGSLDCSRFVNLRDIPVGPVDRSMGDIHAGGNPHYLLDPRAGAAVAAGIAQRLQQLDPAGAAAYQAGLDGFLSRLAVARQRWEALLAGQRGRAILEYHRTLVYLADWLGLEVVGTLEPKPGIPPNPSHVGQLLARARQRHVAAIIQEERYPEGLSRLLARRLPATLVRIPGGTNFQHGQSYRDYLAQVMASLARALEPGGN